MIEILSRKIDLNKDNTIIKKEINLDKNLDCFFLISSDNKVFPEIISNKIIDSILGKISKKNHYKDFSNALENINLIIETWRKDNENASLDIIIGVLSKKNLAFSNIGDSSCYLIKDSSEVIEVTEKNEDKKTFNFISDGDIEHNDIIILGSKRLLNYLSRSDLLDGLRGEDLKIFTKNIGSILEQENSSENVGFTCIKYTESEKKQNIINSNVNIAINNNIKKNLSKGLNKIKKNLNSKSKNVKNGLFITGILICFFLLYTTISSIAGVTSNSNEKELLAKRFIEAKEYIRLASENMANADTFNLNIKNAEEIIYEIKNKKKFLNDIKKIQDEISLIKKEFNGVESFNAKDPIYVGDLKNANAILKNNGKTYIVKERSIIGPIIDPKNAPEKAFDKLEANEFFIEGDIVGNDIILLTNKSKIVRFSKSGNFSFVDVKGQKKWEDAVQIKSYGTNIYLLGNKDTQVVKHKKSGPAFLSGKGYIEDSDLKNIGKIEAIAIDGGIYVLKNDLSMVKVFGGSSYKIEKLTLNKLPNNYNKEEGSSRIKLKTNSKLSYVYMLINNKIFVFKPNTKRYQDTKALKYLGQIEGLNNEIKDFYVNYDGELFIMNDMGVYKAKFRVNDDKLSIR